MRLKKTVADIKYHRQNLVQQDIKTAGILEQISKHVPMVVYELAASGMPKPLKKTFQFQTNSCCLCCSAPKYTQGAKCMFLDAFSHVNNASALPAMQCLLGQESRGIWGIPSCLCREVVKDD